MSGWNSAAIDSKAPAFVASYAAWTAAGCPPEADNDTERGYSEPLDPTLALKHLGPIATVGARRIREFASRPIEWAWQDFAVAGTIVVIAGPSAEGKTTLLFLLLLARATTGEALTLCGRRITPAAPGQFVVLIEAEHGDTSTCRKLVKSAGLLGVGDEALDRVIAISRKAVTLGSAEWQDVERLIASGLVSDIAIDTLARVAPGEANSEAEQVAHFATIASAIERAPSVETRPTAWVLAHTRKGDASALEDVGGSMQRVAQADTVLMVRAERGASGQVVASTVRLLKPREEPVEWPEMTRIEIADGRLTTIVESRGGVGNGTSGAATGHAARVVSYLSGQSEPVTARAIAEALNMSHGKADTAIDAAVNAGRVERMPGACAVGGRRYAGYQIAAQ